jgi:ribosome-binding factor A
MAISLSQETKLSFINKPDVRPRSYRLPKLEQDLYKTLQGYVAADPHALKLTLFYLTRVQLSPDGKIAQVFFLPSALAPQPLPSQQEMRTRLQSAAHWMKTALKTKLRLRLMPQLTFFYDKDAAADLKIEQILATL